MIQQSIHLQYLSISLLAYFVLLLFYGGGGGACTCVRYERQMMGEGTYEAFRWYAKNKGVGVEGRPQCKGGNRSICFAESILRESWIYFPCSSKFAFVTLPPHGTWNKDCPKVKNITNIVFAKTARYTLLAGCWYLVETKLCGQSPPLRSIARLTGHKNKKIKRGKKKTVSSSW